MYVCLEIHVDSQTNLVPAHRKSVLCHIWYRRLIEVSDVPKRLEVFLTLHSVTSHNNYIFKITALSTPNLAEIVTGTSSLLPDNFQASILIGRHRFDQKGMTISD
jgi:hypothetical protein